MCSGDSGSSRDWGSSQQLDEESTMDWVLLYLANGSTCLSGRSATQVQLGWVGCVAALRGPERVCALSVDGGSGLNLASLLTRGGLGTSVRHRGPLPC